MNGFNLSDITDAKFGNVQVSELYFGSTKIWPLNHDYSQDYLTFEALESGNFTWTGTNSNSIYYSINDGSTWAQLASGSSTPTLNANDKILFKASGISPSSSTGIGKFSSSGQFNVMGNIMSLVYGDNFINNNALNNNQFRRLFYNCAKLVNAKNLILPATTLKDNCYYEMFSGCTKLTTPPELPATTLASYCYSSMFERCTSLTTSPELPATTLATRCYAAMFYNCASLNYVKCLARSILATGATNNWLNGVSSTGTFVKDANTTWTTGNSGIPSGWTVQDAS